MDQQGLGLLCCVAIIAIPLGLMLGAAILRAACWMCSVREPEFFRAMGIVFVRSLVTGLVNFGIGFVIGLAAGAEHMDKDQQQALSLVTTLIALPITMLIAAAVYSAMLDDVSYGKGILIWLAELLIAIIISIVLGVIVLVVVFAIMGFGGAGR